MSKSKKKSAKNMKNPEFTDEPRARGFDYQAENSFEQINKFGRCNVQLTGASGNDYPAIAQGLSETAERSIEKESDRWREKKQSGI